MQNDHTVEEKALDYLRKAELTDAQIETLVEALGFMRKPASLRHHLNRAGGLAEHSVNVTEWMLRLSGPMDCCWMRSCSPFRVGMLHDLVKCFCYEEDVSEPNRFRWQTAPFVGHGATSVIAAMTGLGADLTLQEALCMAWHMGAFCLGKEELAQYDAALMAYPKEILLTHTADMLASKVTEAAR